ncbi:dual specificity protein phosphatase family protein [filamentous cyanobacterium LEGE 11480]|uniref:Dual specificity protein phosphatase family protein n=1 Tax=Romeriopsis navalis LEGE 11480 TaxID=2777977 RepID=A0A928Z6R4_9CYAN|nr:dual specificity protein phosphatase [Romeriopsis navalis]MBE9033272.1 dual specificity protein phosphatase family protein [Romeriopsis navalis LEGE 11480]
MNKFLRRFGSKSPTPKAAQSKTRPAFRWIVDRQLAVGPIPDATLQQQLIDAGFKSILTLCSETEGKIDQQIPNQFNWRRLVLPDSHYAELLQAAQLKQAVEFVAQSITQQPPIYVHCLAGMERSPSVCVAYLCLHQGMEVWEALNWVKQRNARTSLNRSQVQAIQTLVQQINS